MLGYEFIEGRIYFCCDLGLYYLINILLLDGWIRGWIKFIFYFCRVDI